GGWLREGRRIGGGGMVLACTSGSSALAQSQSSTLAELAAYDGPDRTQRLIAGAKKEGVVNIYSSITVDDMKVISGGFEKKYGIKLQARRASPEKHPQTVPLQGRGGPTQMGAGGTPAPQKGNPPPGGEARE